MLSGGVSNILKENDYLFSRLVNDTAVVENPWLNCIYVNKSVVTYGVKDASPSTMAVL